MNAVQSKIFEIYLEIKKICEKYSIRYWAIGGTCLGAVRHRGFIPWDSDMDIAMPDIDYYRFLEVAAEEFRDTEYEVRSRLIGDMVTRVFDTTTTEIAPCNMQHPERYIGVHVDIMPFCGMPGNVLLRRMYAFNTGLLHFFDAKRVRTFADNSTKKSKLIWCISRPLIFFLPIDFFYNRWVKRVSRYRYDDSEYTCFLWGDWRWTLRLILKTEWFNDWIELPFESAMIRCPKDYDSYLRTQYGDYMTPPPKEEQENQDEGWFVDLNRPYKYYQKHGLPKSE